MPKNLNLFQDKNNLKKYLSSALPSMEIESLDLENINNWSDFKVLILKKLPQNKIYLQNSHYKFRDYNLKRDNIKKAIKNYVFY